MKNRELEHRLACEKEVRTMEVEAILKEHTSGRTISCIQEIGRL